MRLAWVVVFVFVVAGCKSASGPSKARAAAAEQVGADQPTPRPTSKTEFVTFLGGYPPTAPFDNAATAAASGTRELAVTNGQFVDWWSLESGERVQRVELDTSLKVFGIAPAAASNDGSLFAFGADGGYVVLKRGESKVWLSDIDKIAGVSRYDMLGARFSPDNKLLFIESEETRLTHAVDLEQARKVADVPGIALLRVGDERSVLLIPPTVVDHNDWSTTQLSVPDGELVVATDIIDESRLLAVGLNADKTRWTFTVFDGVAKNVLFEHAVEMSQEGTDEAQYIEDVATLANVVEGRLTDGVIRFGAGLVEDACFDAEAYERVECPASREVAAHHALPSHELLTAHRFTDFSVFQAATPDLQFMPIYVSVTDAGVQVIDLTKGMSPIWSLDGSEDQRYAAFLRRDFVVEVWDVPARRVLDEFNLDEASDFDWSAEMLRGSNRGIAIYLKDDSVFAATSLLDPDSFEQRGQVLFERNFVTRKTSALRRFDFPSGDGIKQRHHAWSTDPARLLSSVDTSQAGIDETLILRTLEDGSERETTAKWSVARAAILGDWVRWAPSPHMVGYGLRSGEIASDDDAPFTSGWNPKTQETWTATLGEIAAGMAFADISADGKLLVTKADRNSETKRQVHLRYRPTGEVTTLVPPEDVAWATTPVVHFTKEHLVVEADGVGFSVFAADPPFELVGRCTTVGAELTGRITRNGWLLGALEGHLPWAADVLGCARTNGELTVPTQ